LFVSFRLAQLNKSDWLVGKNKNVEDNMRWS